MDDNYNSMFIKADNNRIINKKSILWIQKIAECMEICTKRDGCIPKQDTHHICKDINKKVMTN